MDFPNINYETLPEGLRSGMRRYVEHKVLPGSFLQSVLKNDFLNAVCKADDINVKHLRDIAVWVYNELPYNCWGSDERVNAWIGKS